MRKSFIFALILCVVLASAGCSNATTKNWQTISIPGCGTMKIPEDWQMFEEDDRIYIVDADDRPIMIQTLSYCGSKDGQQGPAESNAYFENVTPMKYLSSAVLSNCAVYGEMLVSYEGTQSTKLFLDVGYDPSIEFIVWDETVDMDMLVTIAETFVIE